VLATCLALLVAPVRAQEATVEDAEPASESPTDLEVQLQELQARIAELEAAQEQAALDDLLREAEAAAATAPPPAPAVPARAGAFNPGLTAFGDGFWSVGLHDGAVSEASGPWIRSLELDLRADVDPYAKAVAVMAFEQESPLGGHAVEDTGGGEPSEDDGHADWAVVAEEVYVELVALPAGLSAQAGLFRLPFGITNRQHPHDLPWTGEPLVIRELLGEEGYADTGVVASWRPRLGLPLALTATAGALAGTPFHAETVAPGWLGRGEAFAEVEAFEVALGASGTGRGSERVLGADLMARWRGSSWRSAMLMAEVLAASDGRRGGFAALQVQPSRPFYLGGRVDWLDGERGFELDASYYTSEFLRLRASLGLEDDTWLAQLQLTFVWGSHPVEPYWVNR